LSLGFDSRLPLAAKYLQKEVFPMSIISDLLEKKITFSQAATETVQWGENLINHDPALTADAAAIISSVKQSASDAITVGESALGAIILPAAKQVETALETALSAATHGLSVPFNPMISAGIDTIANTIHGQIDAWALKAKADLASPVANTVSH
jgi:hypothetical protein